MNKKFLLEQIQTFRPSEIKINGKITKVELIRGIFEQGELDPTRKSATKDMMELDEEGQEGIGDIRRETEPTKSTSNKSNEPKSEKKKIDPAKDKKKTPEKPIDKPSEKPKEEPQEEKMSGDKIQKTGLKFATDLGFKAVAINDAFKKMDEAKQIALKGMFSSDELRKIINSKSKSWKSMTPKNFYCREKNIELGAESDSMVPCWRSSEKDKVRMANQVTRGLLSSYYTRLDENGGEGRFKHPKSGEVWVPMGSRSNDLVFSYLALSPNKNAVIFKMPNNDEDIFVAPMTSKKLDFLFDKGSESIEPSPTKPKNKPEPKSSTKSSSDKTDEERAGELILGIN